MVAESRERESRAEVVEVAGLSSVSSIALSFVLSPPGGKTKVLHVGQSCQVPPLRFNLVLAQLLVHT